MSSEIGQHGQDDRKIAFTKRTMAALPTPKHGRAYYRDKRTQGLMLCVTATGNRTFYFRKRSGGDVSRIPLGRFPGMTVENARKAAQAYVGQIANGVTPAVARQAAKHEQTIDGLFTYWLDNAKSRGVKTSSADEARYDRFLKPWSKRKLSTIHKSDVQSLFARVTNENGRSAANRLLALVKAMFHKAPDMGFAGADPTAGVKKHREEKRDRFLHADELGAFFRA